MSRSAVQVGGGRVSWTIWSGPFLLQRLRGLLCLLLSSGTGDQLSALRCRDVAGWLTLVMVVWPSSSSTPLARREENGTETRRGEVASPAQEEVTSARRGGRGEQRMTWRAASCWAGCPSRHLAVVARRVRTRLGVAMAGLLSYRGEGPGTTRS